MASKAGGVTIRTSIIVVTPPASEPVTIAEVKAELRLEISDDDTYITRLITSSRYMVETYLKRALITQTIRYTSDSWPMGNVLTPHPSSFYLPRPPLQSVTSVTYVDGDGVTQTIDAADYIVDTDSEPGRISPAYDKVWPVHRWQANAIKVTYIVGYGDDAADVPEGIKDVIRLFAAFRYETRTSVSEVPEAYKQLLNPYRATGPWN